MPTCRDCGGVTIEYDAAAGNSFCVQCGTVIEENAIVAEVTFGETSTGAAMVQGSYVGQGQTRARMSGPGGFRGSGESREQTLANARRKIRQVQAALRISEHTGDQALRWYTLAVEHRFTKGRRSEIVVAVCLYVACRMSNTSHMLIDFSDILQLNVFVLGTTYLRLVQTLNIKLPLIDPAHYIHRFAALLEFGDETGKVATDAVRLVQRFNRDWMTAGRRPSGICGASILLAARMNNFRRSVQEIVQVVKIADVTLKKRLDEFKKTASGNLTVDDFRKVWLEEEMDPPAFTRGKEKEERAKVKMTVGNGRRKQKKRRRRKPGGDEDGEDDEEDEGTQGGSDQDDDERTPGPAKAPTMDPSLLNQGILAGAMSAVPEPMQSPLFLPDAEDETAYQDDKDIAGDHPDIMQGTIDPRLVVLSKSHRAVPPESLPPASPMDDALTSFLTQEVSEFIENEQGNLLADALDTAERRRQSLITPVDELLGLDEVELDCLILSEEEVKVKERIWVELNRDYLENIAAKALKEQNGESAPVRQRKRRKTGGNKPRDASNAHGKTAAESVRNFVTKSKKFSRKINYSAYDTLFGGLGTGHRHRPDDNKDDDDKDDDADDGGARRHAAGLVAFDDKSDGEYVVVEEGGGDGVGTQRASKRSVGGAADGGGRPESDEEDLDAEGEKAEDTWGMDDDDAYQQEV